MIATARLITPPAALAVSLAQAITAARADGAGLDADVEQAVRGFTENAEHATRRAFITQTWRATLHAFPPAIKLPNAPLQSVVHVKFYDTAGVQRTLDPQDYIVDAESEPGLVVPAPGKAWPATAARINAVEVQYKCGYGDGDAAVPDSLKSYVLAKVAEQFAQAGAPSPNIHRLLDRYRVFA
jgi:uncharacterized phiE125 gp8 family phage protein